MQYRNIKVKVPTPEISRMVQEKLFEKGVRWLAFGNNATFTDSKFLFIDSDGVLTVEDSNQDYFERHYCKQVHYLQILTGDDNGSLYRNQSEDVIYYHLNGESYWCGNSIIVESVEFETEFNLGLKSGRVKLINVNEEEITMRSNEMPKLEAGKHFVKMKDGREALVLTGGALLYLDVRAANTGEFGGWDSFSNVSDRIEAIYEIENPAFTGGLNLETEDDDNQYLTLIWKRDSEADKRREEYEQLQRQIADLQSQANKLGESL